ncbi:DMT family transporter [Parabacteroides sp. BX2]|jgi:drug/metabolite transporter (DMT)-like permease|uniref:DMT family transporter n=1 Tax=Parabacteroides segnis TaxID=2763058 RepID=A0ABR7E6F8_9BACT|nr:MULTISPECIES: DMT family transporter [Parabacteroides]MBC5645363.1 DMT family transporter [Parabacteroides segnis]MCM0715229.1 DMT family transporter [Parabacteroides sp. TA-V-105]
MDAKLKGSIYGIVAAISYGTNPLGALSLYEAGVNANSVLFYRFFIASIFLSGLMFVQNKPFRITRKELVVLGGLGILFGVSSLTLFLSFYYMDAGIASTILFIYPVIVTVIMAFFFKEKISLVTILSILLSLGGIGLLYKRNDGSMLNAMGVLLVMLSSLSYALYIIIVNKSSLKMPTIKLTLYVLLFCTLTIIIQSFFDSDNHIQLLTTSSMWMFAIMLALVPTVISLVFMVMAVRLIGSTPTAIMGALEPLTAVFIGIMVFNEMFTLRLGAGIMMILIAVILIIIGKSIQIRTLTIAITYMKQMLHKSWKIK